MQTLDLKKSLKHLYSPSAKQVQVVDVPPMQFVMINGAIETGQMPGTSPGFQECMGALYGMAYTLKFMSKLRKEDPIDYPVMACEGLWWVENGEWAIDKKDNWAYQVMILQPEHINQEMFAEALAQLRKKKGDQPAFARLRLETFAEGCCIQVMHIGPYATEPETIKRMDAFAQEHGFSMHGKHHEIYMGNPLRANPDRLKTILRHPVK